MNELQKIWLEAYKCYLQAVSALGEYSPSEYVEAREHADAVLSSLIKAGEANCG